MAAPERENVAPLGPKVLSELARIDREASAAEKVLMLGDGLILRPGIISQINEIIRNSTS